jgi:hypothetical protein
VPADASASPDVNNGDIAALRQLSAVQDRDLIATQVQDAAADTRVDADAGDAEGEEVPDDDDDDEEDHNAAAGTEYCFMVPGAFSSACCARLRVDCAASDQTNMVQLCTA